ncbi:MAG: hypothetical protein IJF51_04685, partial [Clostridia bacterium]|nr:hypothetical protein [Clostridia bacterium]
MPDVYFNKSPKKRRPDDDYEDISSFSSKRAKQQSDAEFRRVRRKAEAESPYYDDYSEIEPRRRKKARKRRGCGCGSAFTSLLLVFVLLYLAMSTVFLARMDYEPGQHKGNSHISGLSLKKSPLVTNIL